MKAEHTFFANIDEIFTKVVHFVSYKENLIKFKRIVITESIFIDYNKIKPERNNRIIYVKPIDIRKLNKILLK